VKSCRYCKSPRRFNPCWWPIVNKGYRPGGGDPPCYLDAEYDQDRAAGDRMRHESRAIRRQRITWVIVAAVATLAVIALARGDELIEPTPQEYADIQKWIPQSCCWTNNCCKKVKSSALVSLSRDDYRVRATGQDIKRTGWSRDGQTWRCTCDNIGGKWIVSVTARTHCIFPVPTGY
jgi:hypothetical protein